MTIKKMDLFGSESSVSNTVILYHGSCYRNVIPQYGYGPENNDYGQGFYLTPDIELAKEWSAGRQDASEAWLYTFKLELTGLSILDMQKYNPVIWIATLLQYRSLDREEIGKQRIATMLAQKYGKYCDDYDLIYGWRADDSYFQIARMFISSDLDAGCLNDVLRLGNLGMQYCCKSQRAFERLGKPIKAEQVDFEKYSALYQKRDAEGRRGLINYIDGLPLPKVTVLDFLR